MIYAPYGKEINVLITSGSQGPGLNLSVTQSEKGYTVGLHLLSEGLIPKCISELELEVDGEV